LKKIYLLGAGGHGKVIIEMAELSGYLIRGVFDDNENILQILQYPVLGKFFQDKVLDDASFIISVGNNKIRKKISQSLSGPFVTITHPSANLSSRAELGEGSVVMAGAVVNSEALVGRHVILNSQSVVEHDCILEDFVHISPNASLAGEVKVGEGSHIGIGACVIQGINIGKWCTVGAGAVIIRDVPDGATVVGNPGKIIKK
tara:strand:- start:1408 stop:2013 length:606 start_codon:yes stop_codon:yes gene_type:complete